MKNGKDDHKTNINKNPPQVAPASKPLLANISDSIQCMMSAFLAGECVLLSSQHLQSTPVRLLSHVLQCPACVRHLLRCCSLVSSQCLQRGPQPPLLQPPCSPPCVQQALARVKLPLGTLHCCLLCQLPGCCNYCSTVGLQRLHTRLLQCS